MKRYAKQLKISRALISTISKFAPATTRIPHHHHIQSNQSIAFGTETQNETTSQQDDFVKTAKLLLAANKGNLEEVKHYIEEEKIDIDKCNYDFRTALHLAAAEGHYELVEYLIGKGATINVTDRWNRTPLQDAISSRHMDVASLLLSKGGKCYMLEEVAATRMNNAASEGDLEQLQLMVKAGYDVNLSDYDGRTPLHLACASGNLEIVKYLIENGANINAIDNFGTTPVQDAIKNDHHNLVEWLSSHGAVLASAVFNIIQLPEFTTSLQKSVELLCQEGKWSYGEVWVPHRSNKFMKLSKAYTSTPEFQQKLAHVRSSQQGFRYRMDEGLPGRVWKSGKPEFVENLRGADLFNLNILQVSCVLAIPIVYDERVLAVILLYDEESRTVQMDKKLTNFVAFANQLVASGVPAMQFEKLDLAKDVNLPHQSKMLESVKMLWDQGVFDNILIFYEAYRFFYYIGIQQDYFRHLPAEEIARHIASLIAAKKVALSTTGDEEKIWLKKENSDGAYYMVPRLLRSINKMEAKIDDYLKNIPEGFGYTLESFTSENPIIANGKVPLCIYVIKLYSIHRKDIEIRDSEIYLTDQAFYFPKKPDTVKRYEFIIRKAEQRKLTPVIEKFEADEDGHIPVMIGFQNSAGKSYLSKISELVESIPNMQIASKFVEVFSNGLVVYSLRILPNAELDIDVFLNKASLLAIIPDTRLYELLLQRKITTRQLMYAYSAAKFCFYFTQQFSDEYFLLKEALQGDITNLARLERLQNRLKRDALTMNRIYDCIFQNVDLVRNHLYEDFSRIAGGIQAPSFNEEIHHLIKRSVYDPLDATILTSFLVFNSSILKTNFYKFKKAALSFRLDPSFLKHAGYIEPPYGIFLIIGSDFMGFHVRFRDVARGGVRIIKSANEIAYHTNAEELFLENFNLALTQQMKNKDIPEGGSKGTILLYPGYQDQAFAEMAFKKYIDSLMDMMIHSRGVYDWHQKPEILFLGPDEYTANLMDWAALHAKDRHYPYWKAFTTGKSPALGGIPHDVYGMTTNSVHQYKLGIYEKLGLDETKVTKVQTGGPDGDLGSNEIMISKDKTIAVVDGSGVLYDPEGINREELVRLAKKKVMIKEFNTSLLSPNGFKVLITDSDVKLPDGTFVESGMNFRNTFHLNPLFKADLFVPCGGRPASIDISNVHKLIDKDGTPRFKYIVEGANLFLTQDARLVLEKAGVILYKDASANKGGVTSSSLEVLAALSFTNEEFEEHMQVKNGKTPKFYNDYVQEVLKIIRRNARMEFNCIWNEHLKTGTPRCELTDLLSSKMNKLNDKIKESPLWDNKDFVKRIMMEALPSVLIEKLGLETILKRVPESYLRAIFGTHLASCYIYTYGLQATEFDFFEYMIKTLKIGSFQSFPFPKEQVPAQQKLVIKDKAFGAQSVKGKKNDFVVSQIPAAEASIGPNGE